MLENQEELTKELIALSTEYPEGFARAIQALEALKINGSDPCHCLIAEVANPQEIIDRQERINNYDTVQAKMNARFGKRKGVGETPVEEAVLCIRPNDPLDEDGQALLDLCKQIQKETTHA